MAEQSTCTKCAEAKPATTEFFYFSKRDRKLERSCKICRAKLAATNQARPEVRAKRNEGYRRRYATDPVPLREKRKRQYYADREGQIAAVQKWQAANPERARANSRRSAKAWRTANPDKQREHTRRKNAKRLATPKGRLDSRIRARLGNFLRGGKGSRSWQSAVGYTLDELKIHLERQFSAGMSWSNIGEWHVDHIIPLSMFTYAALGEKDFRAAWALTNLRPMWATENIGKGARRVVLL